MSYRRSVPEPDKLRVCVAATFAFPGTTGSPILQMQTTAGVAARVGDLYVIRYGGIRGLRVRRHQWEGVEVIEVPFLQLIPTLLTLSMRRRPDVVHAHGMMGAKLGALLSVFSRCRLVLEFHDARTDLQQRVPAGRGRLAHRLLSRLARRRLETAVTLSCSQAEFVERQGWSAGRKAPVIYPSVDEWFFTDDEDIGSLRDSGPIVGYAGNFFPWQGIELLLDAMHLVWKARPDVLVELWGASEKEAAERLGALDSRVVVRGRADLTDMPDILRSMDILTIPRPDLPENTTTSRKLGEYLATGRPLVVTDVADHKQLVGESGAGLVTSPDAEGVAAGILQVLGEPEAACRRARTAVGVARAHFSLDRATDRRIRLLCRAAAR